MRPFPPPDPVAAAFQTGFGPEFGAAFAGEDEFTLEPLRKALAALGDPHLRLPPLVHVAGTNGKGSTVAFTQAILTAADASFADVVKTSIFLTDMGQFAQVNEVYATYFNNNPPARETVQVSGLPRGVNVEISMIVGK